METFCFVFGLIAVLTVLGFIILFNGIVRSANQADNALSSIDIQLKKRFDLVPNLTRVVKEHMRYEKDLLQSLTALRESVAVDTYDEQVHRDNAVTEIVRAFFARAEAYPELRAGESIDFLQRSLNEIEEQISAARRAYNAAIEVYNNRVMTFPSNTVACIFGRKPRPFFNIR